MPELVSVVPPTMPKVLPPGTEVDRHVLEGVLREGGMATIYLGHHRTTQARVAVKILHTEYVHQPDFVARFDREAQLMGRLSSCPQIVSVHDVGALPDGRHYLVMDFVRGHDLRDELDQLAARDEPMDVGRAVSIMRDVAAALAAAHQMDVVHRDVKPSNIMLESSAGREVAKLLDFGISADLGEVGRAQDLTAGGTLIGTTRYMAPEQAAGISNVASVDIWAIGVVLLEMLTGQAPPKKGWGVRGASLDGLPPIPEALRTLLVQLLEPDSTRRIQSAREVEQRLLSILPSLGVNVSQVSAPVFTPPTQRTPGTAVMAPPRPRKSSGSRPMLWGIAAAGVIIAGAMAGWWVVRSMTGASASADTVAAKDKAPASVDAPAPDPGPDPDPDSPAEEPAAVLAPTPDVGTAPTEAPEPTEAAEEKPLEIADAATPPSPKPRDNTKKTRRPRSSESTKPAASKKSKDCTGVVQETRDATILGQWKTVLANTKRKQCWSSAKTERERLRVRALHKLGRYAQCEREGQESGDPTVWSVVELCRKANGG